jgi:formylglycine-generating enzyme required for sulfatase activity
VDWYSAVTYANWLSTQAGLSECYTLSGCTTPATGWHDGIHSGCTGATFTGPSCTGYRLMTESEWERAARAGTTTAYYWGDDSANATVASYAWFTFNAGSRTQLAGGKTNNAYGLFDMSGNVWEWVWDRYASAYPTVATDDYLGAASGSERGFRGGDWNNSASILRSAFRSLSSPTSRFTSLGLRLARTAP